MEKLWSFGFIFQVAELEAQSGVSASSEMGSEELTQSMAEMEALIKAKDEVKITSFNNSAN